MHENMKKLLAKKKEAGKQLSDVDQKAKMNVIGALRDQAAEMLGGRLAKLKKVAVMSDSKEGLEKGLDQAKSIIHGSEAEEPASQIEDEENAEHEAEESPEMEASEHEEEPESEEEIDAKIQELLKKKEQLKK